MPSRSAEEPAGPGTGGPAGGDGPTGGEALAGSEVLVTGATGFIGGRVAERLAGETGSRVTGTGRRVDEARRLEEVGVRLRRADLLDRERTRELVAGQDVVFHVAGWLYGDPSQARPVNVEATADLVRAAAEEGVERFVHVSTLGVYERPSDPEELPIDESHPLSPDSGGPYERTKAEGEIRARRIAADAGLDLAVARPGMVFGPRSTTWSLGMYRAVCEGRPVLVGDGRGHFHPLYVDDLVDALTLCATHPRAPGEAYNLCEEPVTFRTYLSEYGELCGREPESMARWVARLLALAGRLPFVDVPVDETWIALVTNRARFSTEKARSELGWRPRVGYREGLERTKEWLRAEGHA